MPGTRKAVIALIVAAPGLGACQSIFGSPLAAGVRQERPVSSEADYAAAQVVEGRKALDEGRLGAAVAAFRNARQSPEHAAASANGLAIAYSQLGRPDLAERYFREAIALAPEVRRYQANLQLFYRANPVERAETVMALAPQPAPPPPQATGVRVVSRGPSGVVTAFQPISRLVRISVNEVMIGNGQEKAAPARPPLAGLTVTTRGGQTRPVNPVNVRLAPREIFVGAKTTQVPDARRPRVAASPGYPIRVKLSAAH